MPPPYPWHTYLTLDNLVSLLHLPLPVAWSLPLITLATTQTTRAPSLHYTLLIAVVFTALRVLVWLNDITAWGSGRQLDWRDEVVVITGGAGGLGLGIAGIYGMRGVGVAILDVRAPEGGGEMQSGDVVEALGESVRWYKCDVGDVEEVRRVQMLVEKDLGTTTILINNAGIVNGQPLLSLSPASIELNFRINLLSHFHTIQTFLPAMLNRPLGGTIVTVSSVLGHLGPANLSDYAAAKAGLTAMHASVRAEIASMASAVDAPPGAKNVQTILVKPGQLSTRMFDSIETPSSFFGPVIEGHELAKRIVEAVDSGRSGVIAEPLYARYIEWMGVLPYGLQRVARWASGVDRAMQGFSASR
ncbi:hypothetical protein BDV97DRAFT_376992 [Delphinella strobiligena]|nr:hypothetical protein BDV97DRAFT_376992 [Delphinella strobiligena]